MPAPEIWLLAPSIRPDAGEIFLRWQAAGYRVAALINEESPAPGHCDLLVRVARYFGYGASVNHLWRVVAEDHAPAVVIPGSDDLYPCTDRTGVDLLDDFRRKFGGTLGVMHLGRNDLSQGRSTDHPWVGAEFAARVNGGSGPMRPEYFHYFDDTELGLVAESMGLLWRRPEYGQHHAHWTLEQDRKLPAHLATAQAGYGRARTLFETRRAAGFPGSALSALAALSHSMKDEA